MNRKLELSAAYARLILQSGVASPRALLRGSDITEQDLAEMEFISVDDLGVIFRNYDRRVNDSAWTTRLGAQFNIAVHGPLGFAALSAPTLGDAMDVIGTLYGARATSLKMRTYGSGHHYVLEIEDITGEADFGRWMAEVIMKVMEGLLAAILGHPVGKNVQISFRHPAPSSAEQLLAGYDASVRFGAEQNCIAVPVIWRQLPSPLHDESVYRANVIKCRELIETRAQAGSMARAVRNRLSNHFDSQLLQTEAPAPPPTLEQMAQAMHMTSRTLIRRLQRENTAYKTIMGSLRRDYAERLLQDARLKVADVAEILGYRETANFVRAFRRWSGASPGVWRRGDNDRAVAGKSAE